MGILRMEFIIMQKGMRKEERYVQEGTCSRGRRKNS